MTLTHDDWAQEPIVMVAESGGPRQPAAPIEAPIARNLSRSGEVLQ